MFDNGMVSERRMESWRDLRTWLAETQTEPAEIASLGPNLPSGLRSRFQFAAPGRGSDQDRAMARSIHVRLSSSSPARRRFDGCLCARDLLPLEADVHCMAGARVAVLGLVTLVDLFSVNPFGSIGMQIF